MQPMLADSFLESPRWTQLSEPAQFALKGLLQFATRKHCDWIVDGSPKQLADWIGPEAKLAPAEIVNGLRELALVGVVKRGHRGPSGETVYIVAAPLVDRVTLPAPTGPQEREDSIAPKAKAPRQRKPRVTKAKRAVAVRR
jgi:hypothetical protein